MKCFFFNCCILTWVIASWSHMLMNVVFRSVFNLPGVDYTLAILRTVDFKEQNKPV